MSGKTLRNASHFLDLLEVMNYEGEVVICMPWKSLLNLMLFVITVKTIYSVVDS